MSKRAKPANDGGESKPTFQDFMQKTPDRMADTAVMEPGVIATLQTADVVRFDPDAPPQADPELDPVAVEDTIPAPEMDLGVNCTLATGWQFPITEAREDADPLDVRVLRLLERVVSGGLINAFAVGAPEEAFALLEEMRKRVAGPVQV